MFTATEKADEARREVALRRRVYPNRVLTRRMTQAAADRHLAIMEAIQQDYERMAAKEDLFEGSP